MSFKSLIIFALVASIGRVLSAPLEGRHLGARNPCHRSWCARDTVDDGYPNLVRRLASFDNPDATLSSGTPGTSTAVDPSATVDPSSIPSDCSSSIPSGSPPAIPTVSPSPLPTDVAFPGFPSGFTGDGGLPPSSTQNGTPQATDPAAGNPVTVTVISTVFLNPTNPAVSFPPGLSSSSVSPPPVVSTSVSSPAPSIPPAVSSLPPAAPSPSVIELTNIVPGTTVSSNPAGQPTPSPSPTGGIIFLPPI